MNLRGFLQRLRQGVEDLRKAKAEVEEIVAKADRQEAEVQKARKHADTRALEVKKTCEAHSTRIAMTRAMLEMELHQQREAHTTPGMNGAVETQKEEPEAEATPSAGDV